MDKEKEPKRAVIEYRETPFEGKPRTMNRVIDAAVSPEDAHKQFWATPVWSSETKKIEVIGTYWFD